MNEPEIRKEPTQDFALEELQDEVQALRTLMSVSLIVLVVFSFCVNWYIFKQASMVRAQITADKQTADAFQGPAMNIWAEMVEYGRTHADFAPVLEKYRPYFPTVPNSPAPVPAAAPKPK